MNMLSPSDGTENHGIFSGYSAKQKPLAGYAMLVGLYSTALVGFLFAAKKLPLPERIRAGDLLLLGVATHKLSRIVAKDKVTSPFRAPFVRFERSAVGGEVVERRRSDTGLRAAIGDLVSC